MIPGIGSEGPLRERLALLKRSCILKFWHSAINLIFESCKHKSTVKWLHTCMILMQSSLHGITPQLNTKKCKTNTNWDANRLSNPDLGCQVPRWYPQLYLQHAKAKLLIWAQTSVSAKRRTYTSNQRKEGRRATGNNARQQRREKNREPSNCRTRRLHAYLPCQRQNTTSTTKPSHPSSKCGKKAVASCKRCLDLHRTPIWTQDPVTLCWSPLQPRRRIRPNISLSKKSMSKRNLNQSLLDPMEGGPS